MAQSTIQRGSSTRNGTEIMRITLEVPDNIQSLLPHEQESIAQALELELQLRLSNMITGKTYKPENIRIMKEAIKMSNEMKAKGTTRKEAFKQFREVLDEIDNQINKSSHFSHS